MHYAKSVSMSDKAWEVVDQRSIIQKKRVSAVLNDIVLEWRQLKAVLLKIQAEQQAKDIKKAEVVK